MFAYTFMLDKVGNASITQKFEISIQAFSFPEQSRMSRAKKHWIRKLNGILKQSDKCH